MSSLLRNMVARLERQQRISPQTESALPDVEEHGNDFVIRKVASMDRKPEAVRGGRSYIHGSSLIGICPRRYALTILAGGAGRKSPREQDRILWAIGRAVEKHIRDSFIAAMKRKGVIGRWVCACGKTDRAGEFSPMEKCPTCKTTLTNYKEIELFDHERRIVGNPDLPYIRPDNRKIRITEIKSKKTADFEKLVAPEPDHVSQALIYRRLGQINQMDMDDEVSIVYAAKDYTFKGKAYKEFHVQPTAAHEALLDDMWSRAGEVKAFLMAHGDAGASAPLPHRLTVCSSPSAPFAKGCDQCSACFAR